MCGNLFGGGSQSTYIPAPIAPAPEPLKRAEEEVTSAKEATRKRAASLASLSNSTLTSPLGLSTQATTQGKTLLGQ